MSVIETRRQQMFPVLDAGQIETARRFASGPARSFRTARDRVRRGRAAGSRPGSCCKGSIDVMRRDGLNQEAAITTHHPGQFSGELSQLGGRASLAQGRAGADGCTALPFDAAHVRALMIGSAEVGEIMMRAFILRRVGLLEIKAGGVGSVLVGNPGTADLARLEDFLRPQWLSLYRARRRQGRRRPRHGRAASAMLPADLPLMVCPNGTVLKCPTEAEAGICLGITPELDPDKIYDVAVVGAGPAGLATAVYAGIGGAVCARARCQAFGGQAGASARIENYLGFPTGISGLALTARAFNQALKFGVEVAIRFGLSGSIAATLTGTQARRIASCSTMAPQPGRGPWSSRRARATAGLRSPTLRNSRAREFPIGRRRSRRSFARARRWRWSAAAIRQGRPWCSSRRR